MTRTNAKRREFMSRPAIAGGVLVATLAAGLPALAEQGGDPTNRTSVSDWLEASRMMPAPKDARVVEAAAPATPTKRFHDKTVAEWRAYHTEMREFQRRNSGQ